MNGMKILSLLVTLSLAVLLTGCEPDYLKLQQRLERSFPDYSVLIIHHDGRAASWVAIPLKEGPVYNLSTYDDYLQYVQDLGVKVTFLSSELVHEPEAVFELQDGDAPPYKPKGVKQ